MIFEVVYYRKKRKHVHTVTSSFETAEQIKAILKRKYANVFIYARYAVE